MLRFAGKILGGGLLGTLLLSVIVPLFNIATDSSMLRDGQYGLIFLETAPVGWMLGAGVSTLNQWSAERPPLARWVAGLLIASGIVAGPLLALAGLMAVSVACRTWH